MKPKPVLYLADSSYETAELWKALPPHVTAARTARNRACTPICRPANASVVASMGCVARPADWFVQRKGYTTCRLLIRGRMRQLRYRLEGPVVGAPDVRAHLWQQRIIAYSSFNHDMLLFSDLDLAPFWDILCYST